MYKSQHIITSKHYLVLLVASFAAGIFISLLLDTVFAFYTTIILFSIFIIAILFSVFFKKIFFKTKHYILPLFMLLSFLAGIFRVEFNAVANEKSVTQFSGQEAWIYGTLSSEPGLTSNKFYYSFELDVFKVNEEPSNGTIIVYIPKANGCDFNIGDSIFFWGDLKKIPIPENISNYDYFINLSRKNIFLTANAKNINPYETDGQFSLIRSIKNAGFSVRNKILVTVDKLFPEKAEHAAILKGLLIGDKTDFDDEMYNKFSNAGISHIVAVSGLHLSLLFSFLMTLIGSLRTKRNLVPLITLPFIILFVSASGFTPSVLRASIMIFLMMLSAVLSEDYDPVTSLFAAFGILIAVSPYSILSKSLVLSFSATLGIFVYFRYINSFLLLPFGSDIWNSTKRRRLFKKSIRYLSSSLSLSLSSFLGTAYFIVLFFGKISKVQFLTNLWIIPTVTLIFCLGYIACIIFYISPWFSLNVLKYPLDWFLDVITVTLDYFGDNRFSYNYPYEVSSFAYTTVYFGAALIIYMTLKAFSDIRQQKKKAAEKSGC
ncbi:MAG: ComEC/Rec2 family competence protein [Clostridia bacterium]|nr:ComEC/Rec2 family competence protein [Clostridia bacterium]